MKNIIWTRSNNKLKNLSLKAAMLGESGGKLKSKLFHYICINGTK